ncbi:MAG: hypothetical protein CM15mP126_2460 [Gammaproteobacteria bacterium]|nr:MAG: hypothetical protein CM15mP126_2460 [Gammaproteobacteria bacterium]
MLDQKNNFGENNEKGAYFLIMKVVFVHRANKSFKIALKYFDKNFLPL